MGHDILGFNHAGEEIAYARFSMWNDNATILYNLLNANKFYAGVSGCGQSSTFSAQQMEKAWMDYKQFHYSAGPISSSNPLTWDLKQIREFIQNCAVTAKKEGSVTVYFG